MVKPALDDYWLNQIYSLLENEPRITDGAIARRLQKKGEEEERDDYPAQRTVNKYRKKWKDMTLAELLRYRYFQWPESMVRGDLPWEASAAGFMLLRALIAGPDDDTWIVGRPNILHIPSQKIRMRPTVRAVEWFWRVTQAMPNRPEEYRWFDLGLAKCLEAWATWKDIAKDDGIHIARDVEEAIVLEAASKEDFNRLMESLNEWVSSQLPTHSSNPTQQESQNGEEANNGKG